MISNRKDIVKSACEIVRTVLHHIPENEPWPRLAIETAEAWVRGEATEEQVRAAGRAVRGKAYTSLAAGRAAKAAEYAVVACLSDHNASVCLKGAKRETAKTKS